MKEYKISQFIRALRTGLLIAGLILIYVLIIGPSPVLSYIAEEYRLLDNNAAHVLTVSIVYPISALRPCWAARGSHGSASPACTGSCLN